MLTTWCAEREVLRAIKRLCTERNCFRKAKPDEAAERFYKSTMSMVDDGLRSKSEPNADLMEAVAGNIFQVLGNAAAYFGDDTKAQRKDPIVLDKMEHDVSEVCRYFDETTGITARYNAMEERRKKAERADTPKRRKLLRIARILLFVLSITCAALFLSGMFVSDQPVRPEAGNIFSRIAQWYKYDVRKEALPVTFAEKWVPIAQMFGTVAEIIFGVWSLAEIVSRILQRVLRRRAKRIRQEWSDYQRLCGAMEKAALQEDEWEW